MNVMKENTGKAWYLIQCKARQAKRAEENLLRQSYVCYHPKIKHERLLRGQRKMLEESLFPGYLFIQLSKQDNWAALRSTRGVSRIVGFGGQPLAIGDYLIEQLKQRDYEYDAKARLLAGEKVRINEGFFAELEGIFLAMDGDRRVVLLLSFLQREQKIFMPLTSISKV